MDRMSRFKLTLHWPSKGTISMVMTPFLKKGVCETKILDLIYDGVLPPAFCASRLTTDPLKDPWSVLEPHGQWFCLQLEMAMVCIATVVARTKYRV